VNVDAGAARQAQLRALKLQALVREHGVGGPWRAGEFGGGAALMAGTSAWTLVAGERSLGAALAWALRRHATELHVAAETGTGTLARRAPAFAMPIAVWHVDGRALLPAIAQPLPSPMPIAAGHEVFVPLIEAAGAQPVIEHGVLGGEVYGLEVCRVVDGDGGPRLEVGIGSHDREAFQLLHGDRPTVDALAGVVRTISEHRRPGAAPHALNRIARERSLRAAMIAEPGRVGALGVVPVAPPVPRPNLKDPVPCVALANTLGGLAGLVCTTGLDLDAVPFAVDARAALEIDDIRLVVPTGNDMRIQHDLVGALRAPLSIVTV
jgi:hypothetical protein